MATQAEVYYTIEMRFTDLDHLHWYAYTSRIETIEEARVDLERFNSKLVEGYGLTMHDRRPREWRIVEIIKRVVE